LNVEDVSGDEISITSVKGEGFASDLSDSEPTERTGSHKQLNRNKIKKTIISIVDANPKRPATPMEIRPQDQHQTLLQSSQQQQQKGRFISNHFSNELLKSAGVKYQQISEQPTNRFNEWDPFSAIRQVQFQSERHKSPLKTKQPNQQQSNFAYTFLNTESSPRQSSGRSQIGSASNLKHQQVSSQHSSEIHSSSNLDLIVSGQKLGTNLHSDNLDHLNKPFIRRLQPIEKGKEDVFISEPNKKS
jgi:hypothetical protein